MNLLFILFSLITLTLVTLHFTSAQNEPDCVTNTLNGPIRGEFIRSGTGKELCRFYGIPFATPPLGELRFKRPLPIPNWSDVFNATALPRACTQDKNYTTGTSIGRDPASSEDCLYLNLFVPYSIFNSTSRSSSVMIWIHGGGFTVGSISEFYLTNGLLAGDNDVIVAYIQYRLGPLGTLYFGTDSAPGNMGLLDQNLAIQWIYNNIGEFGGNNDEITLFGQSAGSFSVSYHALSPLSRPYFKRGILLSGSANSPIGWRSKEDAIEFSYEIAEHAGCYNASDNQNVDEIISCLKSKDKFLVTYGSYESKYFLDLEAIITVDDYFLLDSPDNLLNNASNSVVDLMIGSNHDEAPTLLLTSYPDRFNWVAPNFTKMEQEAFLRKMFANRPDYEQDAIVTHYTSWENFNDIFANGAGVVEAGGDSWFVCPAIDFARRWSMNGPKVYSYFYTHAKLNSLFCGDWMGACHGSELEYLFGMPITNPTASESEKALSRRIQTLFVNFAKSGIPSVNWLEYKPEYPIYLDINGTIQTDITTSNIFGPRPYDCPFWNIELPRLRDIAAGNEY